MHFLYDMLGASLSPSLMILTLVVPEILLFIQTYRSYLSELGHISQYLIRKMFPMLVFFVRYS